MTKIFHCIKSYSLGVVMSFNRTHIVVAEVNWSAPVNCYPARGRCPSGISTGTHPVCHLHQSSCWRHCKPRCSVPPVCRRHAASPCDARRQHIRRTVRSCRMYCRRRTCRTACSSTRTNQKHWLSERHTSYALRHQPCRPSLSPTSICH